MHEKRDWLQEPIIVVPLAFACFALIFLPLRFWNVGGAAQFYGAFFSAVATIIAVFAAAYLSRRHEDLQRRQTLISFAVELYYWSHRNVLSVISARRELELIKSGRKVCLFREIRQLYAPVNPGEANAHSKTAAKLPPHVGAKIVAALHILADQKNFVNKMDGYPDDTAVGDVSHLMKNCDAFRTLLDGMRADLSAFLVSEHWFERHQLEELEDIVSGISNRISTIDDT